MTGSPTTSPIAAKAKALFRWARSLPQRIRAWFLALNAECRSYAVGLALLALAASAHLLEVPAAGSYARIGAFVFSLGLLPPIESLYEKVWERLLGKLFIAATLAVATNIAYGCGRQLVSLLIGTSPEPFSSTVNIATLLLSPILFLAALAIGGAFIFVLASGLGMVALTVLLPPAKTISWRRALPWGCRFIALGIAVFGSLSLLNRTSAYNDWAGRRTTDYLYHFDLYHDPQYATGDKDKVALLPDGRVLVGTPSKDANGYDFQIRASQSDAVPPPAPAAP